MPSMSANASTVMSGSSVTARFGCVSETSLTETAPACPESTVSNSSREMFALGHATVHTGGSPAARRSMQPSHLTVVEVTSS